VHVHTQRNVHVRAHFTSLNSRHKPPSRHFVFEFLLSKLAHRIRFRLQFLLGICHLSCQEQTRLSSGTIVVPAPLPPRGVAVIFWGGWGGVVVVVIIRVRAPHFVKETPGFFVVMMGKDDMPFPTTTRHVPAQHVCPSGQSSSGHGVLVVAASS
jgi:hypothetical protein